MSDMIRRNNPSCRPAAGNAIRVATEENIREVNLRNGAKADVGIVIGVLDFIKDLTETNPEHFQLILNLARNENATVSRHVSAELKRAGVIARDGTVTAIYRDVLLSACQQTAEGIVLTSPFAPQDPAEATFVQAHVNAYEDRLVRFARKLGMDRPPDGEGPDR
jgi:hypothetical protein